MEFILIAAGSFLMGSSEGFNNEKPPHLVEIAKPFYFQKTEVTQGQWKKVMGVNPSFFNECGDECPVENVSWDDVQRFIKELNQREKTNIYRLPSEAEWEYACRGLTTTKYSFGDNANELKKYAWHTSPDGKQSTAHKVATKAPNPWGAYDTHGNVWEWVEDDWHDSYQGAPTDGRAWLDNPRGLRRVLRGGSWMDRAISCRSAMRYAAFRDYRNANVGFRLCRSLAP